MLWARVVRGAASSAKPVTPAAARRCRPAASKGLSMPMTTAPAFSCAASASLGVRTLSTMSAESAPAASVISAPAVWYAASVTLAAMPAPACTRTVCPEATSFFTVSGVTATRVSPAAVSAGTPINIEFSSGGRGSTDCGQSLQQDYKRTCRQNAAFFLPLNARRHCTCSYLIDSKLAAGTTPGETRVTAAEALVAPSLALVLDCNQLTPIGFNWQLNHIHKINLRELIAIHSNDFRRR
ncbi:hypothetical protein D9M68_583180 [compost metagenome]